MAVAGRKSRRLMNTRHPSAGPVEANRAERASACDHLSPRLESAGRAPTGPTTVLQCSRRSFDLQRRPTRRVQREGEGVSAQSTAGAARKHVQQDWCGTPWSRIGVDEERARASKQTHLPHPRPASAHLPLLLLPLLHAHPPASAAWSSASRHLAREQMPPAANFPARRTPLHASEAQDHRPAACCPAFSLATCPWAPPSMPPLPFPAPLSFPSQKQVEYRRAHIWRHERAPARRRWRRPFGAAVMLAQTRRAVPGHCSSCCSGGLPHIGARLTASPRCRGVTLVFTDEVTVTVTVIRRHVP